MKDSIHSAPSTGKRIFLWFAALALILACVPGAPAPIATLDPNDINLFIQQTALAASAQTLAAVPPSTVTPTITATPRNTFTPEPTQTPFMTFVLPTMTPAQRVQFYRVKHDSQIAKYHYKSRTANNNWDLFPQTPETVPLFAAPKSASGTQRTTLHSAWENYINGLNGFDSRKLAYLKSDSTGLFNGSGFPQLESLTMGGNVITIDEVQGEWGKVHTMDYNQVGSVDTENYKTRPDLVHKFVVVGWSRKTKTTYWVNPPPGVLYWPFVSRLPIWISMDRVEPFPILPMEVTANVDQEIRVEPRLDADTTGKKLSEGQSRTIVQYYPSSSQVWGRLQNGTWIALFLYQKTGPTYLTTWIMETLPPPP